MSNVAAAAKVAKPTDAPAAQPAKPAQTLREVKPKTFAPSALQGLGYGDVEILTVTVPADWTYEEVLKPVAWTSVAPKVARNALNTQPDRIGSLIYVNTVANTFTAWLRINAVVRDHLGGPNGLDVICVGPSFDPKTGKACPMDVKTGLPWAPKVEEKSA